MPGQAHHHFKEDRPFASPEAAARKLVELIEAEMAASNLPHAYTGTWNSSFTRAGDSIAGAGRDFGMAQGWFRLMAPAHALQSKRAVWGDSIGISRQGIHCRA
jgi:hypothetical protein